MIKKYVLCGILTLCVVAGISITTPTPVNAEAVKSDNGHCGEWEHHSIKNLSTTVKSKTYARQYGHSATSMVGEGSTYAEADPDAWARTSHSGYLTDTGKAFWDIW